MAFLSHEFGRSLLSIDVAHHVADFAHQILLPLGDMLEKLPLRQAHLMSFELIPIGPLNPLRQLPGMKANP